MVYIHSVYFPTVPMLIGARVNMLFLCMHVLTSKSFSISDDSCFHSGGLNLLCMPCSVGGGVIITDIFSLGWEELSQHFCVCDLVGNRNSICLLFVVINNLQ